MNMQLTLDELRLIQRALRYIRHQKRVNRKRVRQLMRKGEENGINVDGAGKNLRQMVVTHLVAQTFVENVGSLMTKKFGAMIKSLALIVIQNFTLNMNIITMLMMKNLNVNVVKERSY